jgi:hypothetical protein
MIKGYIMKRLFSAFVFFILFTSAAHASTVFDLRGKGGWDKTFSFNEDGIGLTATTGRQSGITALEDRTDWLYQSNGQGLGMYSPFNGNSYEIDGGFISEAIQFYFDQAVKIVGITFGKVGKDDDFDFYFNDGSGLEEVQDDIDIGKNGKYVFSSLWAGNHFAIGADSGDDSFTIKKLEVAAISITAVPLPVALPLYGTGIAVMGFLAWRRRRNNET